MRRVHFLTHPEIALDPAVPITKWPLSERGVKRLRQSLPDPCFHAIRAVYSSAERKATETAEIVTAPLGLGYEIHSGLGENDRSSTGYLPRAAFERTADQFFAEPNERARGWARAIDEQARIVGAARRISMTAEADGTTLIVSHGAVGALLMAALIGEPISRRFDQPGDGGGNWFAFDSQDWTLLHGWRPINPTACQHATCATASPPV